MVEKSKRDILLQKLKKGGLNSSDKSKLRKILEYERLLKQNNNDTWGALVIVGILSKLEKAKK